MSIKYTPKPETRKAYVGKFSKHVGRVLKSALRKAGIMNKDCKVRVYENSENGTVELEVKEPYLTSRVFKIAKQAILAKINPESKRPTKLRSEAEGSLSLYRF